jgi:hypothetical protein
MIDVEERDPVPDRSKEEKSPKFFSGKAVISSGSYTLKIRIINPTFQEWLSLTTVFTHHKIEKEVKDDGTWQVDMVDRKDMDWDPFSILSPV